MKRATVPSSEAERLQELSSYNILDTLPELEYDDITFLASQICGTPIALISLVDESRQWFKSKQGLGASETSRDLAFCSHAILQSEILIVEDATKDERFHDNPLVVNDPNIRFYAGAPLKTSNGFNLGTLCIIDHQPKSLNEKQKKALEALSRQVIALLELRRSRDNAIITSTQQMELGKKLQQNLILEKEQALADAKTKSSFLANMSHEIRTPLNAVLGMANLLSEENLSAQGRRYLELMRASGHTLLVLINDILDFSKIEAGKLTLEDIYFSPHSVVTEIVDLLSIKATEKGLYLKLDLPTDLESNLSADATRLRQVLTNLIGNAIKFTSTGGVTVSVKSLRTSSDSCHLMFDISDTGQGIALEARGELFKSFSQIDASTTRKFGGTGLGLAICQGICNALGGKISVESKLGRGSIFSFFIKAKIVSPELVQVKKEPILVNNKLAETLPLQILVADDNYTNQLLAVQYLEKLGYKPNVAANGLEVLDGLKYNSYNVIFMDGQMPEMDGFEATKKIRESNKNSTVPWIIAFTASATAEDRDRFLAGGMNDFVSKPFDINSLAQTLLRYKAQSPASEPASEPLPQSTASTFNLDEIKSRFMGDMKILIKVAENFVQTVPEQLNKLKSGIDKQDAKEIARFAHSLKGVVGIFSSQALQSDIQKMESYGKNNTVNDAKASYSPLEIQIKQLLNDLSNLIENNKKAA